MKNVNKTSTKNFDPDFFRDLMFLWQNQPFCDEVVNSGVTIMPPTNLPFNQVMQNGPCLTYILNVRTGHYEFVSDNVQQILGYSPQDFTGKDLAFVKSLIHPQDSIYLWKMLIRVWQYLLAQPCAKRELYQYNCDYRIKKANNDWMRILEQNTIIKTDQKGNITHLLGMCTDITNWRKSSTLTASVVSKTKEQCFMCTSAEEVQSREETLSKREREVLQLIAQGYNSKFIADRLCISFHTVNTHRQKMIAKTNTKNTGRLVQYAISNEII